MTPEERLKVCWNAFALLMLSVQMTGQTHCVKRRGGCGGTP